MGDLGDLSGFLKDSSLSDLSWLDVNEEEYRALDRLPKQNLDISPDLQAVWAHEDKPASAYLLPNKDNLPKTMGDMSDAHGKLASTIKTASRLQLYISSDLNTWKSSLVGKFGLQALRDHKVALAETLTERGLLGRVYVAASDFPTCYKGDGKATQFIRKVAAEADFVVAKPDCSTCIHAVKSASGQSCAVFHKNLVLEVPYTESFAARTEALQKAKGKSIQASSGSPRERVRLAMLAPQAQVTTLEARKPVENTTRLLKEGGRVYLPIVKEAIPPKAKEVLSTLRKELLRGRSPNEAVSSLKVAFSTAELQGTRPYWENTFKEAGLYGQVYTTQDSFDECRDGVNFLAKHGSQIKAVVAGAKCDSCFYNKAASCLLYGKALVKSASELYTEETVKQTIWEHRLAGKLETGAEKVRWGSTPEESLREIYRVASGSTSTNHTQRMSIQKGFTGTSSTATTSGLVRRDIIRTASRYLNEGLYGKDLLTLLRSKFDQRDLVASKEDLRTVLAEQGLQGLRYIDPTIYSDYGKGCHEAERLHRSRLVPYVKLGSACGSCVHQARAGHCSILNKKLVNEVPYLDKKAEQQAILSSGRSTETSYAQLMNNGLTVMAEYQLQNNGLTVELNDTPATTELDIQLGSASQGVKI